jgi:hypothetical protein
VSYAEGTSAKARKSTDIEPTPSNFRWQVITSKFLFDYPIIFKSGEETEQPILKKIKIALSMVERNLDSSNILLNNTYRSKMDELLDEKLLAEEAKSKKKNVSKAHEDLDDDDEDYDDAVVKEYQAEILLDPEFTPAPGLDNFISLNKKFIGKIWKLDILDTVGIRNPDESGIRMVDLA